MTNLFVALNTIFTKEAVAGAISTLDLGLNLSSLFGKLKKVFLDDSIDFQLVCALDESLKEGCCKVGWNYDNLAVSEKFYVSSIRTRELTSSGEIAEVFGKLLGRQMEERTLEVFIDCFDKSVSKKPELAQYLSIKWRRYRFEKEPTSLGSVSVAEDVCPRASNVFHALDTSINFREKKGVDRDGDSILTIRNNISYSVLLNGLADKKVKTSVNVSKALIKINGMSVRAAHTAVKGLPLFPFIVKDNLSEMEAKTIKDFLVEAGGIVVIQQQE